MKGRNLRHVFVLGAVTVLWALFIVTGCGTPTNALDRSVQGPQLLVNPEKIRLSVVWLKGATITFSGAGFRGKDSVYVELLDVNIDGKTVNLPIASGDVQDDSTFDATVNILSKFNDIMRADLGTNEKMENIIIITKPPIPKGTYTARAVSMESDIRAECKVHIVGPSMLDRFKDWMGGLMGKIVKK